MKSRIVSLILICSLFGCASQPPYSGQIGEIIPTKHLAASSRAQLKAQAPGIQCAKNDEIVAGGIACLGTGSFDTKIPALLMVAYEEQESLKPFVISYFFDRKNLQSIFLDLSNTLGAPLSATSSKDNAVHVWRSERWGVALQDNVVPPNNTVCNPCALLFYQKDPTRIGTFDLAKVKIVGRVEDDERIPEAAVTVAPILKHQAPVAEVAKEITPISRPALAESVKRFWDIQKAKDEFESSSDRAGRVSLLGQRFLIDVSPTKNQSTDHVKYKYRPEARELAFNVGSILGGFDALTFYSKRHSTSYDVRQNPYGVKVKVTSIHEDRYIIQFEDFKYKSKENKKVILTGIDSDRARRLASSLNCEIVFEVTKDTREHLPITDTIYGSDPTIYDPVEYIGSKYFLSANLVQFKISDRSTGEVLWSGGSEDILKLPDRYW